MRVYKNKRGSTLRPSVEIHDFHFRNGCVHLLMLQYLRHLEASRSLYDIRWSQAPVTMLRICSAVSGDELTLVDAEDFQGKSSKELKSFLTAQLGHPRFRQRLFDEKDKEIDGDNLALSPQNIQLVVLELLPPDPKQDKNFLSACSQNQLDKVEVFLQKPQDPNVKDQDGMFGMHHAALRGHDQCVSLLLEASADLEARHKSTGKTALHFVAQCGHATLVRLLVEKGADKDSLTEDENHVTAMHFAASEGHLDVLLMLIHLKAAVDVPTINAGATPLHFASLSGHADVAYILLKQGAGVELETQNDSSLDSLDSLGYRPTATAAPHPAACLAHLGSAPHVPAQHITDS